MRRPTALLVDDEPKLVAQLRGELEARWPELEIVGEALDGPTALDLADARQPDVAFLDIRMPGMSGLDVARRLAGACHVVFVTAYDQYAVQAFEGAAVDYVLKPVGGERLALTIERLKGRLGELPRDAAGLLEVLAARLRPKDAYLHWLKVQHRQDVVLVPVDEVVLFQSSDKYTLARTRDQEWIIRTPLKDLEQQLDPERFWRVHRNAIVRVAAVAHVRHDESGRGVVHFKDVALTVPVSRTYAGCFKQM